MYKFYQVKFLGLTSLDLLLIVTLFKIDSNTYLWIITICDCFLFCSSMHTTPDLNSNYIAQSAYTGFTNGSHSCFRIKLFNFQELSKGGRTQLLSDLIKTVKMKPYTSMSSYESVRNRCQRYYRHYKYFMTSIKCMLAFFSKGSWFVILSYTC